MLDRFRSGGPDGRPSSSSESSAVPLPRSGLMGMEWFASGASASAADMRKGRSAMSGVVGGAAEALGGSGGRDDAAGLALVAYTAWVTAVAGPDGWIDGLREGRAPGAEAAEGAARAVAASAGRGAAIAPLCAACLDAARWQARFAPGPLRGAAGGMMVSGAPSLSLRRFAAGLRVVPDWAWARGHGAGPGWGGADVSLLAELIAGSPRSGGGGEDDDDDDDELADPHAAASGAGGGAFDEDEDEDDGRGDDAALLAAVSGASGRTASGSGAGGDAGAGGETGEEEEEEDAMVWLRARCRDVASRSAGLPAETLETGIVAAARESAGRGVDPGSDAALQMALFELLGEGDGGMDLLTGIMGRIPDIVAAATAGAGRRRGRVAAAVAAPESVVSDAGEAGVADRRGRRRGRGRRGVAGGAEATGGLGEVMAAGLVSGGAPASASDAAVAHSLRRGEDRDRATAREREEEANEQLRQLRDLVGGVGDRHVGEIDRMRASLPPGGTYDAFSDYVKIHIPAPASAARAADEAELVQVTELDEWARVAFQGIERLNPLQSAVFPTAYSSSENLLVCAPTGAGKTNVAMLAVCRELSQHFVDGVLQRDDFKIVYVAPMKALAAEVTSTFGRRLAGLGVRVRELTGDMQLTRREIAETQMLVVTPEKWDVITRKSGEGAGGVTQQVRLLIIDEVHLLADGRGAVIESLVARTLRQVEASQSVIRLVGLSATLPNYQDVGLFLRVNPETGLFHFGPEHRPVPLAQTLYGVACRERHVRRQRMTDLVYEKCVETLSREKQVMIFVHSRKDTGRTGKDIAELAAKSGQVERLFGSVTEDEALLRSLPPDIVKLMDKGRAERGEAPLAEAARAARRGGRRKTGRALSLGAQLAKSKNHELRELVTMGIGMHHAGMLRSDRTLCEQLFLEGEIKVLVCTATLAWGVNLPAHTVIIKGTDVYNAEQGGFVDLSVLDVLQIFGRAGRPQFDVEGEACIVTTADKLAHYQQRLLRQTAIESSFIKTLPDHLNAEVVSGSVANVREAVIWMSYTYLFVRMLRNPTAYGIRLEECRDDPMLEGKRIELICTAARRLDDCRLLRYDERSGALAATDMGRVASHFYIRHESMDLFYRELSRRPPSDEEALALLCRADEFKQLRARDEEIKELEMLRRQVPFDVRGDVTTTEGKANVLLQAYISGVRPRTFTLVGDTSYITQSAGRIARGLFEISVRRGWGSAAASMLALCKAVDRRVWWHQSPLRQLVGGYGSYGQGGGTPAAYAVPFEAVSKIEAVGGSSGSGLGLDRLADMSASDIGALLRFPRAGPRVKAAVEVVPHLHLEVSAQPITRSILRVRLVVTPGFRWVDRLHGGMDSWWIWVEDDRSEKLYHHEQIGISRAAVLAEESQELTFTIPVPDPVPPQLWVRATHDRWQGVEETVELPLRGLVLPDEAQPHTDLLDLVPLPKEALHRPEYEALYSFTHFNPIQTQIFHVLYHTDHNALVGAPTGSGKTVAAELSVFRLFNERPGYKAVYIAPLKALVSERVKDWGRKFGDTMGKRVVELTGDVTPDTRALQTADILVTTPEKWDGISRSWQRRGYVQKVGLVVIDEIHLLGEDRGPVLEVIVSRMRYIAANTGNPVRVVGLSTALANAGDLADWLGIDRVGLYNFRPSVRPIPMDVHIQGFPGKHYCPRMATMNKPTYAAIAEHSPDKPALVFVSSRRQTRLTALELISLCATDENPRRFLHMDPEVCEALVEGRVKDAALRHTLVFGVGIHHAGLPQGDRDLVEELFVGGQIQILVCTSTLAWGVNFPAHLVVVKGTEYFDGKLGRYVDFAITDVLQMMGRAGRPQFDDDAVAVIMVHEPKKQFYRKFLYEPFPVESQLRGCLADHISAEVASGTIRSRADAADWLTWTYFFRRLVRNPSYYHLDSSEPEAVSAYLSALVDSTLEELERCGCVTLGLEAAETLGIDPEAERVRARQRADRRAKREQERVRGVLGLGLAAAKRGKKAARADAEAAAAAAAEEEEDGEEEAIDVAGLVAPTTLGHITSFYYLSHATAGAFEDRLLDEAEDDPSLASLGSHALMLQLLCEAPEFAELPVRHTEELLNEQLAGLLPWQPFAGLEDPHVKAFLLVQAHMARVPMPISDYATDTRGDVGSWVRIAASSALARVARVVAVAPARISMGLAPRGAVPFAGHADDEASVAPRLARAAGVEPGAPAVHDTLGDCVLVSLLPAGGVAEVDFSSSSGVGRCWAPYGRARVGLSSLRFPGIPAAVPGERPGAPGYAADLRGAAPSRAFELRPQADRDAIVDDLARRAEAAGPAPEGAPQALATTGLTPGRAASDVGCLLRLAVEKQDRVRAAAGRALSRLLWDGALPALAVPAPMLARLREAVPPAVNAADEDPDSGLPAQVEAFARAQSLRAARIHDDGGDDAAAGDDADAAPGAAALASAEGSNFAAPDAVFPRLAPLLSLRQPLYARELAEGLSLAVGGLSESVVKSSTQAVTAWAKAAGEERGDAVGLETLLRNLLVLLRGRIPKKPAAASGAGAAASSAAAGGVHDADDDGAEAADEPLAVAATRFRVESRLVVPVLRTINALLTHGKVGEGRARRGAWSREAVPLIRFRVMRSKDPVRVMEASQVLLGMVALPQPVGAAALHTVLDLLAHPFPKVRRLTGERLFATLMVFDDLFREGAAPEAGAEGEGEGGAAAASAAASGREAQAPWLEALREMSDRGPEVVGFYGCDPDSAMAVLSATAWDGDEGEAATARDALYPAMGMTMPEARLGALREDGTRWGYVADAAGQGGSADGLDSYMALVKEAGY